MKNDPQLFLCECYDPAHHMIVDISNEDCVFIRLVLNRSLSFFTRLANGFKYVFGIGNYNTGYDFEEILLNKDKVLELERLLHNWRLEHHTGIANEDDIGNIVYEVNPYSDNMS